MTPALPTSEARAIATAAFCDPRSVIKALSGQPLAPLTLARIRRALADMGRSSLLAPATSQGLKAA